MDQRDNEWTKERNISMNHGCKRSAIGRRILVAWRKRIGNAVDKMLVCWHNCQQGDNYVDWF